MAHHHSKFVSVNLNKSYGQQSSLNSNSHVTHGRARSGSSAGGGMVVLSRPRSSGSSGPVKTGSRLSVPPPLNLPSLRKEHERLDVSAGTGSNSLGSGRPGSGHGSTSVGWTKTGIPPTAPAGGSESPAVNSLLPARGAVEKTVFLRGEDFPTLSATVASEQKQRDFLSQRQKMKQSGGGNDERSELLHSPLHMRPQMMKSSRLVSIADNEQREQSRPVSAPELLRKNDGFLPGSSPLPVIRLAHTSNWADDERDTGLNIPDRDRSFSRTEFTRDNDAPNIKDFYHGDSFGRDLNAVVKESNSVSSSSWRSPLQSRDVGADRDRFITKPVGLSREINKDINGKSYSNYLDNGADGLSNGIHVSRYGRRDYGSGTASVVQNGRNSVDAYSTKGPGLNLRGRYSDDSNSWFRKDAFQNSSPAKSSISFGNRGPSSNDQVLHLGREKKPTSSSSNTFLEDASLDSADIFGDVSVKMFKRKKEVVKQTEFHDPVRESFEAELERVQRLQEQERQRVMEEQERVLELARKEQEERERLASEEDERRRRIEEEEREAARRAEEERIEAARRADEQRIAREEEKRRVTMEEERRKEAARQKLLELEARIARRNTEIRDEKVSAPVVDERALSSAKERDEWEDSDRMVDRITSSAPPDPLIVSRFSDAYSRSSSSRDASEFQERGMHGNYWRKDAFENGNSSLFHMHDQQQNSYRSPVHDTFNSNRGFSRREFHGSPGSMPLRPSSRGGRPGTSQVPDDFRAPREDRWNHFRSSEDYFRRNSGVDSELIDHNKFGDGSWGSDRLHESPHASYGERLYQSSEADGFSSFGRSRYSMRQPRVLPPPTVSSVLRSSFRPEPNLPSSSAFLDNEIQYPHAGRDEEAMHTSYDGGLQQRLHQSGKAALGEDNTISVHKDEKGSLRCDSQSSLSVSSPPSSPTHLSHDDMDGTGETPTLPVSAVEEQTVLTDNEHAASPLEAEQMHGAATSNLISNGEDDEWPIDNNGETHVQDEYDEDEDGYQEEDEAHEGDDQSIDLVDLQSDMQKGIMEVDQLIGFNEGIQMRIPSNEDFERSTNELQAVPDGPTQEMIGGGDNLHLDNIITEAVKCPSNILNEAEKTLHDLVLDPVVPATSFRDNVGENSGVPAQQQVSPALSLPVVSAVPVQPTSSVVSTASSHTDKPFNLQFGLFSGPSLIPTPVPAIQIGSIPLHLHPQVGPSISQMHPPQAPMFQLGQLSYTSPISQGILPLAPQPVSFVQPPPAHFSLNRTPGLAVQIQSNREPVSNNVIGDKLPSHPRDMQPEPSKQQLNMSPDNVDYKLLSTMSDASKSETLVSSSQINKLSHVESKSRSASASQADQHATYTAEVRKNYQVGVNNKDSKTHLHAEPIMPNVLPRGKTVSASKAPGDMASGARGRRFIYTVRNSGSRSSFQEKETLQASSCGFQRRTRRNFSRTEFVVRDNMASDRRQLGGLEASDSAGQDERNWSDETLQAGSIKQAGKNVADLHALVKTEYDKLNSGASSVQSVKSEVKLSRAAGKEAVSKTNVPSFDNLQSEGKRSGSLEEDADAPQSGVVRVFKQPGIETPIEEDDFIEVKSKRQMLNDRRQQREKEMKAKTRAVKAYRKHRAAPSHGNSGTTMPNRSTMPLGGGTVSVPSDPIVTDGRSSTKPSPVFPASITSQTLPPVGIPVSHSDPTKSFLKSSQPTVSVTSSGGAKIIPGLPFDNKTATFDNASIPLGSWSAADINQQVMALTQTQLDEAMETSRFEPQEASTNSLQPSKPQTSFISESSGISTPSLMQEKPYSSASPLNSLLAGEKIQFGAITSPTFLPPVRSVSNVIGPLTGPDVTIKHNAPGKKNDHTIFFDKEKHSDDSCAHLDDPEAEAEAEAAASAVAVAAITNNDDIVGNRIGESSISVSDAESFRVADASSLTSRVMTLSQIASPQSAREESLAVSLPADLSVDTPSLALWQPLPSPQSSSGPMIPHFPGAPPSHFPCFEVNPMLGAPIFAFGPQDESSGTQSQAQRSTAMGSAPLGGWPQCHSGVDSFYGPPAGFAAPFISPSGITGVQGPPHMVVYNHFAPVGQFGQVGLSFMGTYIPTGKQTDWKHNPATSTAGVSEGDTSINGVSGQRAPPNMPAPLQHMPPGSPLVPMPSPVAMFDMSRFQPSTEVPLQAQWNIAAPPLHAVPITVQVQQHQIDRGMLSHISNQPRDNPASSGTNNLSRAQPAPPETNKNIPVTNAAASQFPVEHVLVEPPATNTTRSVRPSHNPAGGNNKVHISKNPGKSVVPNAKECSGSVSSGISYGSQSAGSSFKLQVPQQPAASSQQYLHHPGHSDQRGPGASHKMGSGGEWHRRIGPHGRNQNSSSDKNFGKVKQIYVAKQPVSGPTTG